MPEKTMLELVNDLDEASRNFDWDAYNKKEENSPLNIVIKPDILDLSELEEGENEAKFFRPISFDEYIGQERAKDRVNMYIEGHKKYNDNFPHVAIFAKPGTGKTLFANILANKLNKKFVCCSGGDLKREQDVVDKIVECNQNVLFLDECHMLSPRIATFLLTILEEWKIVGKKIKPFICIIATTHKGNLASKSSALIQRFKLEILLESYKKEDLVKILKQFILKQYPNEIVDNNVLEEIALNCRQTPRLALTLLIEYIYSKNINKVKENSNIINEGITFSDLKVLQYLKDNVKGASKNTLANFLQIEPKTYDHVIEPFLISKEFITIESKRKITNKGLLFINSIKKGE
ncbi:MAG TPA: AAA family ATPase [Candidatus Paceibacterota bacterium]|nr:AAA family ATPase [Candidatus Paceibacterota bacterium]